MQYRTANAYYLRNLIKIGGIESHFYYLARKYGKYDITVFYYHADPEQVKRLKRYVNCIKLKRDDVVICENLFCCFNREILDQCEAKYTYLVLHGDYKDMVNRGQLSKSNLPLDDRIDKYLGVSRHVCNTWTELTGLPADFIGEPVVLDDTEKPLLLCSATRLTAEKGWNRMKILAKELNRHGVKFLWLIFTNQHNQDAEPNMIFQEPRLDITELLPMFDAYVQLSDNEGFCLSVVEALLKSVPVIGTELPVFKEIGLNYKNSILLNLDMKNIPIDRIRNIRNLKVNYTQPYDRWDEYLDHTPTEYHYEEYRIRATSKWLEMKLSASDLGHVPQPGEEWIIDSDRYKVITDYERSNEIRLIERL